MGGKICKKNVLLLGDAGAGKTTLLYHLKLDEFVPDFESTEGFNYEVVTRVEHGFRFDIHLWDVAGQDGLKGLWRHFYEHTLVQVVTYVLNANIQRSALSEHIKSIFYLMQETPLRQAKFIILLNVFDPSDPRKISEEDVARLLVKDDISGVTIQPSKVRVLEINARNGDGLEDYTNEICLVEYGIAEPPNRI
jgi:small GTP-binding protein